MRNVTWPPATRPSSRNFWNGCVPADPAERRWGWWRLYDAYGCAIRSYAFAVKAGKARPDQLNRMLLEECEAEIAADGEDQLDRARHSAYGTSFPEETKRAGSAGWYFSSDAAFDLAVALQLDYPSHERSTPRHAGRADQQSELRGGLQSCQYHLSGRPGVEAPAVRSSINTPKTAGTSCRRLASPSETFRRASAGPTFIKRNRRTLFSLRRRCSAALSVL